MRAASAALSVPAAPRPGPRCTRDVIYMKGEANGAVAEVALQYNDSYNELILSFANNVTPRRAAPTRRASSGADPCLNDYGRKNGC